MTCMTGVFSSWGSIWRCKLHLLYPMPHVTPQPELCLADEESQRYTRQCAGTSSEIMNYNYSCKPLFLLPQSIQMNTCTIQVSISAGVLPTCFDGVSCCLSLHLRQSLVSSGFSSTCSEGQFSFMFNLVCLIIQAWAPNSAD